MTTTKKLTDSTVPKLTTIADTALVAVFDPASGAVSKTDFATLKQAVRESIFVPGCNLIKNGFYNTTAAGAVTTNSRKLVFSSAKTDRYLMNTNAPKGTKIFVSFYAKALQNKNIVVDICDGSTKVIAVTTNWQKFEFMLPRGGSLLESNMFLDFCIAEAEITDVWISDAFVGIGNVSIGWNPAPEDLTGGVKTSLLAVYAAAMKGGLPHEHNKEGKFAACSFLDEWNFNTWNRYLRSIAEGISSEHRKRSNVSRRYLCTRLKRSDRAGGVSTERYNRCVKRAIRVFDSSRYSGGIQTGRNRDNISAYNEPFWRACYSRQIQRKLVRLESAFVANRKEVVAA